MLSSLDEEPQEILFGSGDEAAKPQLADQMLGLLQHPALIFVVGPLLIVIVAGEYDLLVKAKGVGEVH